MRSSHAEKASTSLVTTETDARTVVWLSVKQSHTSTFSARITKKALAIAARMKQLNLYLS